MTVTVTPTYGDPDLYVNLGGGIPTYSNWTYKSMSSSGADSVVISTAGAGCRYSSSSPDRCSCSDCTVLIAVIPFSANASYSILVTTASSVTALQDNVPVRGSVSSGTYQQFRFTSPSAGSSLTVSLTVISGDADLTISLQPNPSVQNGTWMSRLSGGDTITITPTVADTYYIGVNGFLSSDFSILAHMLSDNASTHLMPGTPQVCVCVCAG